MTLVIDPVRIETIDTICWVEFTFLVLAGTIISAPFSILGFVLKNKKLFVLRIEPLEYKTYERLRDELKVNPPASEI